MNGLSLLEPYSQIKRQLGAQHFFSPFMPREQTTYLLPTLSTGPDSLASRLIASGDEGVARTGTTEGVF